MRVAHSFHKVLTITIVLKLLLVLLLAWVHLPGDPLSVIHLVHTVKLVHLLLAAHWHSGVLTSTPLDIVVIVHSSLDDEPAPVYGPYPTYQCESCQELHQSDGQLCFRNCGLTRGGRCESSYHCAEAWQYDVDEG